MTKKLLLLPALAALVICASGAWAAIGVYGVTASANVPSNISYILNTDATQVTVQIVPAGGGAAVKTWTFTGGAECAKGAHPNAVTWTGDADGGGNAVPGNYQAVVTATAAAVAGANLVPLWEYRIGTNTGWTDVAVNKNPASPWYGYVYATNYTDKGVYMFDPAGTQVSVTFTPPSQGWTGSAPWGVDVDDDGSVYVSRYSNVSSVSKYAPNGGAVTQYDIAGWNNPRALAVDGGCTAGDLTMFLTYFTGAPISTGKTISATGCPPPAFTVTTTAANSLSAPDFDSTGGLHSTNYWTAGTVDGGSLMKVNLLGAVLAENTNIRNGVGLAITPDDEYMWVSRFVSGTGNYADADATALYRIPFSAAYTTANPDTGVDCEKFGITPVLGTVARAMMIDADGVGNVVAAVGSGNWVDAVNNQCIGVYAPPDNGSVASKTTTSIHFADRVPVYNGDNGPCVVSICNPASTAYVEVYVSDLDGYTDIERCYIDLSAWGLSDHTRMDRLTGSGNNATYFLEFSLNGPYTPGDYETTIYVRDMHYNPLNPTDVPETEGAVTLRLTGGWISGTVTNSATGQGVAGATVTAVGPKTASTVTAADGTYVVPVAPGGPYSVTAHSAAHIDSGVAANVASVACGQTVAGANIQVNPMNVRECTMGNYYQVPGRPTGDPVCVQGIVMRTHYIEGSRNGYNGYYYIYDTLYQGTQQGVRVNLYAGQPAVQEGDKVVVDGTWTLPAAIQQGRIVPSKAPFVVSTGNPVPNPSAFYYENRNNTYGRLFRASGPCVAVEAPNKFTIKVPTGTTNPTPVDFIIQLDTAATAGATLPTVGDFVEVTGVVASLEAWAQNVLAVGKLADLRPWPTVNSLAAARAVTDGGVIIDLSANPLVISYADPGELGGAEDMWFWVIAKDRSSGLKVDTAGGAMLPLGGVFTGDEVTYLKGNMSTPANASRVLTLVEAPTVVIPAEPKIPGFLGMPTRSFAGGWTGKTPGRKGGVGLNTDGLLIRIVGRAYGYGNDEVLEPYTPPTAEWFYLDDGSGVLNEGGHTGIKVWRSLMTADPNLVFPVVDGTLVAAEGISSSFWSGSAAARVPILHMRYDPLAGVSDQVWTIW